MPSGSLIPAGEIPGLLPAAAGTIRTPDSGEMEAASGDSGTAVPVVVMPAGGRCGDGRLGRGLHVAAARRDVMASRASSRTEEKYRAIVRSSTANWSAARPPDTTPRSPPGRRHRGAP